MTLRGLLLVFLVGLSFPLRELLMMEVRGGAERTTNFGFTESGTRTHGVAAFTVTSYR